jgi:DNA-binding Lrp family transcriptional regulator
VSLASIRRSTANGFTGRLLAAGNGLWCDDDSVARAAMKAVFVQVKCHLGKAYKVAEEIAEAEIASEIYSTAGDFDLLVKFYVPDDVDTGHFVTESVQRFEGIRDTRTIVTFKAF